MFLPNVCECAQNLEERNQNRENEKEMTELGSPNGAWLKAYICSKNVIYCIE